MTTLLKIHWDRCLLMLAVVMLALTAGWAWRQSTMVRKIRAQSVRMQLVGGAYAPAANRQPGPPAFLWPKPVEQSAGSGWLYEVFTPPIVYYHPQSRSFSVTPPASTPDRVETPFGLALVGVKAEPFRLQLAGFFGGPDDLVGAFAEPGRPEILLARTGRRFENLGLTLRSIEVRKVAKASREGWPDYDVAAIAVLHDERSGTDVVLNNRTRQLTGRSIALVRISAGEEDLSELFEGGSISSNGSTYRVDRIQLDPPEMTVVRQLPGRLPDEPNILQPTPGIVAKSPAPPTGSSPAPGYSPPGLVSNVK